MKSTVAYYLMLLYVTVMLKPLIPIVSDWWQHEFNEMEHLSQVHAIYGNQHLQQGIADTGADNDHSKNQSTLNSEDQVAFHLLVAEYKNDFNSIVADKQFESLKYPKPSSVLIAPEGPPPRFA
ncbi:MAG: hypothetical protein ABI675_18630 [Chitinophagaceae bacterium]